MKNYKMIVNKIMLLSCCDFFVHVNSRKALAFSAQDFIFCFDFFPLIADAKIRAAQEEQEGAGEGELAAEETKPIADDAQKVSSSDNTS